MEIAPMMPLSFEVLGRGGGIGRHAILRGWWAKARGSSNLPLGTKTTIKHCLQNRAVADSVGVKRAEGVMKSPLLG
jgi:hypothetical protein